VARHALLEPLASAEDRHRPRVRREEHRRLAGRVAGPDDLDVEPVGARRLAQRRAVGDPLPDEVIAARERKPSPRDAGGEDERPAPEHVAAVEVHLARGGVDPHDRPRNEDLRPEPPRLPERSTRELIARDTGRKAKVVLDAGRGAGLTPGRLAL